MSPHDAGGGLRSARPPDIVEAPGEIVGRIGAMATVASVRALGAAVDRRHVVRALSVFTEVEEQCTRFRSDSPLMMVNDDPDRWHQVPHRCFEALVEAERAYHDTRGRFDPRVLADLIALGYDRTLAFGHEPVSVEEGPARRRLARPPWKPDFRRRSSQVRLGRTPVELGGIGKGLAIRWASERLRPHTDGLLVEAGGDCYCAGAAPGGGRWLVGIEDPAGAGEPLAVLALADRACTTSSTRVRRWRAGGASVHHLIDPRTGLPGGQGLVSVTVVEADPATAEVWSKVLFLEGRYHIAAEAEQRGLAACWTLVDGTTEMSEAMRPYVLWSR